MEVGGQDNKPIRMGLGLAMMSRFIKNSHGQLGVTLNPGKGSVFTLQIPFKGGVDASVIIEGLSYFRPPMQNYADRLPQPASLQTNHLRPPQSTTLQPYLSPSSP
jgi:hypothetical protein